ncbi:hypothetical protein NQ314_009589 [Rhamnusium bicolor]|uniref:PiggyBac transposable element-derived protein 4 C-terminal zinc-finger domain-containing protein n=1 Tax=Rhamnusium bicolor TaxID=1586634 RepID=A0AAV8Y0D5_9CUCU|nr:hypothetical protein NQ314_009589 [Rhamnusium bicolor]
MIKKKLLCLFGEPNTQNVEVSNVSPAVLHYLEPNPPTAKDKSAMLRCRECKKRKTRYLCPVCRERPGLCVHPCFKDHHSRN